MKNIGSITLALLIIFGLTLTSRAGQLDTNLEDDLRQQAADELIPVWIVMNDNHDGRALKKSVAASGATRTERYGLALTALKRQARTQENILSHLRNLENQNLARKTKGHWIVNVVEAEVTASELKDLAARSDVDMIYAAPVVELIAPVLTDPAPPSSPDDVSGVTGNLQHIRADSAWANGFTGEGSLVCSFDTGVRGDHPALLSSWKGHDGDSAAAWFDPVYGESFPHAILDQGGVTPWHGTHTLGIIVGADSDSADVYDTVGVAPGAKWIAAAVIDIAGASILDAFEWAADPDGNPNTVDDVPDVISHSWGFKDIWCLDVFYTAIDNSEALGTVNIFSAGNEGDAINAIRSPADRALDSLDCFAVGNIIHTSDVIATNSSRGPSPCNALKTKPNVVAPGSSVISASYNFETTRYRIGSGTSQAAPHVSGLVALLRQKNPNATVDEIKEAILTTTRWNSAWEAEPNFRNKYGWGEIDCWAALQALSDTQSEPNVRLYDFNHAAVTPGDTVRGSVILQNLGLEVTSVTGQVLSGNSALTILEGSLSFGTISTNDTVRSSDSLAVVVADSTTLGTVLSADFVISGNGLFSTVRIHFLVGIPPGKAVATHTGRIEFTLTDYGVFGLGSGSLFPLGGAGFTFNGGANDMWEAGVMIGTGYSRVSSGVHSYLYEPDMDFQAAPGGTIERLEPGPVAEQQTFSVFDDGRAKNPIGLQIQQESFTYSSPNDDFVILKYVLQNISGSTLTELHFGLFLDFDIVNYLSNAGGYETDGEFVWMAYNSTGLTQFRGAKLLQGSIAAAGAIDYDTYYHWPAGSSALSDGLSPDEKFGALTSGFLHADANKTAKEDLFLILSAGPLSLAPDQLDTLKFVIMAGDSLADLRDAADRAALMPTPVDEPGGDQLLPAAFTLHQNYPNPFNPSTVISFDLPRKGKYRLEVINMLGQTVYETDAIASAGRVEVEWNGEGYASGAYLYRLTIDDRSVTRKMMLLK